MVLRARGGRNAGRSGALRLRRPVRSSGTSPRAPRGPRRRSTVTRLSRGLNSRKVPQNHLKKHKKDVGKPARFVIRKSPRLQNPAGSRRGVLRRSTRPTKPIRTSATRSVLKNMDNMKKKRRKNISTNKEEAYSRARRRTAAPPQAELSDSDSDSDDCFFRLADDDDNITTAEDDSSCSTDRNYEAKPNQASLLYQRASREFLKGSFRTNSSETNRIHRGASRATDAAWSNPSDEDDSEDGGQNIVKFSERDVFRTTSTGLADIDPVAIDRSVGFGSIGGLSGHIAALKEMVIFPLLYPEVFDNFKIQPPRGCLFYGPPGTGKTLVARALANECGCGNRKVSFFMRKGADCLSKWVGESERQLRLLFEQAYHMRPSIIFFDEIDGLAPVRSSRQDHIHSSIVSTLLALMDGLDARGEVVVIGATNRLDAIDPALRRPGRFDREFLFGLPDRESRKEILKIHTAQWKPRPSEDFLDELADRCVGYCGADIRAVCTEATLCALRRCYPQIYTTSQKLLLDVSSIAVNSCDFEIAMKKMSPASRRLGASPAKPLSAVVQPLLGAALRDILEALQRLFPHAEQGMRRRREPNLTSGVLDDGLVCGGEQVSGCCTSSKTASLLHSARSAVKQPTSHRPRLLLAGRPGAAQTSHLAPAVLHALERFAVHSLDSAALFGASSSSPEEACAQVFSEARRTSPSIIYIPHIQQWWETAGPPLRVCFSSLLCSIPSFSPILLLATCSAPYGELDPEIQSLFRMEYGEVYTIGVPTRQERTDFFQDLILHQSAEAPPSNKQTRTETVEILPLAPTPLARQPSEPVAYEEHMLRELRLFLRNVTERLILDRRFKAFSKAADTEVPAHLKTAKRPMDLQRLLANIDEYKYVTVGEYMSDAELVWQDALKWRPDSGAVDRHIRHCALALKNTVHAIVRDELDEDFERECEEIREARVRRASSWRSKVNYESDGSGFPRNTPLPSRKKKRYRRPRKSKWSTGVIKKVKKKKLPPSSSSSSSSSISSQEEVLTSSAAPSSSSNLSESSDAEPNRPTSTVNGCRRSCNTVRCVQNGVQANGRQRPSERLLRSRTSRTPLTRRMLVNGLCWDQKERGTRRCRRSEELKDGRPAQGRPRLLVDRRTLRDLLGRAVDQTEGAEVEPLEKLYALLAQCIYRHRDSYDKRQLLQEMKKEIDSFS